MDNTGAEDVPALVRPVLSHYQVNPLLAARDRGDRSSTISLDLGLSETLVALDDDGIRIDGNLTVDWQTMAEIADSTNGCFALDGSGAEKIEAFSERTDRYYSLMPTPSAPTMLISGIPMHRIKNTDPRKDTLAKIRSIKPVYGKVLDTATGLGYTAIEAAQRAESVTTIEYDEVALSIAAQNPWSSALFRTDSITQLIGDSYDVVPEFEHERFDCVIHDPPMFNLAGHLYGAEFYRELYRILRKRGRLFHYIGDPESHSGSNTTRGVIRRLQEVGFRRVLRKPQAFGVLALK